MQYLTKLNLNATHGVSDPKEPTMQYYVVNEYRTSKIKPHPAIVVPTTPRFSGTYYRYVKGQGASTNVITTFMS